MAQQHLQSLENKTQATSFYNYLVDLHQKHQSLNTGKIANYIPELAEADADWFGICVVTTDGQVYQVGDSQQMFTIQSISKAFVYGLALETHGREYVLTKVGVEPTGEAFNSIVLDEKTNRPYNPMVNSGAIATTDLIVGDSATQRLKKMLSMFHRYTGREVYINTPVSLSERASGSRNRAIAYLMHNFGMIGNKIEETLDLYFQQCSVLMNCYDLAMMGATLANKGVNPITGDCAINCHYVQDVLSIMHTCGMYNYAGEWAYRVGIPAKSGVGGGIIAVVPGKCAISVFSPPLDEKGNSVRGVKVCEEFVKDFGLHVYSAAGVTHDLTEWIKLLRTPGVGSRE